MPARVSVYGAMFCWDVNWWPGREVGIDSAVIAIYRDVTAKPLWLLALYATVVCRGALWVFRCHSRSLPSYQPITADTVQAAINDISQADK